MPKEIYVVKLAEIGNSPSNPEQLALEQGRPFGHHTWKLDRKAGMNMFRLVNLIFFVGCALAVAHYSGLGSTIELLLSVSVAAGLMRILSSKRIN